MEYILTIMGYSFPRFYYAEEINLNAVVGAVDDMIGNRIGYNVVIPYSLIRLSSYKDANQIFNYVENFIPPKLLKARNNHYIYDAIHELLNERIYRYG